MACALNLFRCYKTPKIDGFLGARQTLLDAGMPHQVLAMIFVYGNIVNAHGNIMDDDLHKEVSEVLSRHRWSLAVPSVTRILPVLQLLQVLHCTFNENLRANFGAVLNACVTLNRVNFVFERAPQALHLTQLQNQVAARPNVTTTLTLLPSAAPNFAPFALFHPRALSLQPGSLLSGSWSEAHLHSIPGVFPLLEHVDITGVKFTDSFRITVFCNLAGLLSLTYGKFTYWTDDTVLSQTNVGQDEVVLRARNVNVTCHPLSWSVYSTSTEVDNQVDDTDLTS